MIPLRFTESIKPIADVDVSGKTILLRIDVNSSVKDGKLLHSPKIAEHFKTIKKLLDSGAKLIVLSHQGRKGREDFIDLRQHKEKLQEMLGDEIKFCSWNEDIEQAVKSLGDGKALMLETQGF